jgi:hypothetical protein
MEHITLPVFHDDGRLATREMLEVDPVDGARYRLLHSPAFVDGLAAGDVIELDESRASGFRLISRAGNLAVIVTFEKEEHKHSPQAQRLQGSVKAIGGTLDGGPSRVLVFTVPASTGFQTVETLLDAFLQELPGTNWWYGNVYEAGNAARSLNWWQGGRKSP